MATISIRISEEEREYLMQIAQEYEVTLSWVGRKAIKEFISNYQRRKENGNNLFASCDEAVSKAGVYTSGNNA